MSVSTLPRDGCPKHMVFGPCSGVRDGGGCELDARIRCPFAASAEVVPWTGPEGSAIPAPAAPRSQLLEAVRRGPVVLTDLTTPSYDANAVESLTSVLRESCDAVLVGEHQNRPDWPPTLMAAIISGAGGVPWITLTCRDRNRLVLEQELAGLRPAGADGVLCVTGDGRAPGIRPGVTQVFDLDGTRLAALAREHGHAVAVPEAPDAAPRGIRPARLVEKQRAGAHLAVLNHVGSPDDVASFVASARELGLTIPVIAAVAVYTDEASARVLTDFPGLHLDPTAVAAVLAAPDPREAGIAAAVAEARRLVAIEGVVGVNLSGLGTSRGPAAGAEVKAEIGMRLKDEPDGGRAATGSHTPRSRGVDDRQGRP